LNAVTIKDASLLPSSEEHSEDFASFPLLLLLDLFSEYDQCIWKEVILLQVLQVLQVLQELHEAPEVHLKLTGSNLKQTIAKLICMKYLKHPKHLKQTFFFLMLRIRSI